MPTYEYRCPSGHEFERFYRKISDAAPGVTCPECGKVAERIMSVGGGFAFKGSGFYLTDYGKNAHRGGTAPKPDASGGDSASAAGEGSSTKDGASKETAAPSKESASPAKESGSKDSPKASGVESKPAPAAKPAESKSSSESKPKKSGGSKSKDR